MLFLIVLFLLTVPADGVLAADPYEPNDSALDATGPLGPGRVIAADLAASNDADFYLFYVTGPSEAQVGLTVEDTGGGTLLSDIDVTILDAGSTPVGAMPFIRKGEARSTTLQLAPQKYLIEVRQNEGSGDSYRLSTGPGDGGAFGPYSGIAARCTTATTALEAAEAALRRADSKLQRALGRLRRSRYAGPHARRAAFALYRKARARAAARRRALAPARDTLDPWCSIPE